LILSREKLKRGRNVYFYITGFLKVFIAAARDSTSYSGNVLRVLRVRHLANAENYASLPIPFLTGILRNPAVTSTTGQSQLFPP
jgi:hypothetical protein